ncbi:MAG: hypothetical protein JEZ03_12190 [Bacteroidales bacterium]|nr:hypothetical protein [Bacteroidales bacterium]
MKKNKLFKVMAIAFMLGAMTHTDNTVKGISPEALLLPNLFSESPQDDEWTQYLESGGIILYTKKEFCKNSYKLFAKLKNTTAHQVQCEIEYTALVPVVPDQFDIINLKAGEATLGDCDEGLLVFPYLDNGEWKFQLKTKKQQ